MKQKLEGFENAKKLNDTRETLPAMEVENEVVWVNPAFSNTLPFPIKEGEQTKLGLFLSPGSPERSFPMEVQPEHSRSGILGRVFFEDNDGNIWRDVDVIGLGNLGFKEDGTMKADKIATGNIGNSRFFLQNVTTGIEYEAGARKKAETAEILIKAGLRTSRTIAITKLKEIIDEQGDKISIDEARHKKTEMPYVGEYGDPGTVDVPLLRKEGDPVMEIRAWRTKARIGDLVDALPDQRRLLIEDAKDLIAQEFHLTRSEFTDKTYLSWFAGELGNQLGIMHRNKWVHGQLRTSHNITLDGRIVDFGTAKIMSPESPRSLGFHGPDYDKDDSLVSLERLATALGLQESIEHLKEIFSSAYAKSYALE